jgi:nicotinamidase-related amidase
MAAAGGALGNSSDPLTEIYPSFHVNETAGDVVLAKTRYYAGAGNPLEEILRAQQIDTVILSGIRTSGVIISTAQRLFDLDYKV